MQQIKCYRCKAKGHIAKNCPEASQKPGANVIESEPTQEVTEEHADPWLRTMSASGQADEVPTRGPTYKADITVDNVKTRALLDHGAQVSIVRRELLPKVWETHGWTKEQYQVRNLKLDRQPIGANGTELGAVALVRLEVAVEGTDKTLQVPCYVLNSDKPLWKGELWNCGLVLGTNCLEKLGFSITHPNGQMVIPAGTEGTTSKDTNTTGTVPSTAVCTPEPSTTDELTEDEVSQRKVELEKQLVIGGTCSEEECGKFKQLLLHKHESFALKDTKLGETNLVEHIIDTGEAKPAKIPPRRLPYALRKELEQELSKLESTGCIEPSTSPYASGLVLVRKTDGTLRVCVDYRQVNKDTVPDRYPMPRMDELVDAIGRKKGKYFTTLDLMKGYHQVKMDEHSKPKTAFTCHQGLYQYRRMPFGLTNAPVTFQRLMNKLFSGKGWEQVFVYLDDILIVSASFEDHLRDVGHVLDRLMEAGLRLKPSKCLFARKEVVYLGFTVSSEGVTPNHEKVKAIVEFPQPMDCKAVRQFLGMLNFYRRHIQNLAAVARPLTAKTQLVEVQYRSI